MPCVAKKYEAERPELSWNEESNVDFVVTTRELGRMIREAGLAFDRLPNEDFDKVMGESTGASVIFGTSGGVIEAAARTAVTWLTGSAPADVELTQLRGSDGLREATVKAGDMELKIGIASGLGNARELLERVRDGKADYHAIEIMACPGGCVAGGGQPYYGDDRGIIQKRAEALYEEDRNKPARLSHENKEIQALYDEFLEKPGSHKAHELLHTEYTKRGVY
jgi:NADH-quinone oxidoreductase subunit G/NADP-reducing hydrogenase subunit HndD